MCCNVSHQWSDRRAGYDINQSNVCHRCVLHNLHCTLVWQRVTIRCIENHVRNTTYLVQTMRTVITIIATCMVDGSGL
jgi:hypothetical protein